MLNVRKKFLAAWVEMFKFDLLIKSEPSNILLCSERFEEIVSTFGRIEILELSRCLCIQNFNRNMQNFSTTGLQVCLSLASFKLQSNLASRSLR